MRNGPVPADPGQDDSWPAWEPVITRPDPMTAEEWQARADCDVDDDFDPDGPRPPGGTGNQNRPGSGFSFTCTSRDGPPGGCGTWILRTPGPGPDLIIDLHPITTENCDHRFETQGHDPSVRLRHLAQIRHSTCTSPVCRRPAATCDYEHNTPYEAGGRTCLCNGDPKCRHDHRLKQHPKWKVNQLPDGTFSWTTPSGRTYTTEPTRYPI